MVRGRVRSLIHKSFTVCSRIQGLTSNTALTGGVVNVGIGEGCDVYVPPGQNLSIIASDEITMGPGFHADQNAFFQAQIVDCDNPFYRSYTGEETGPRGYVRPDGTGTLAAMESATGVDASMRSRTDIMHIRTTPDPSDGEINIEVFGEIKEGVQLSLMRMDGALIKNYKLTEVGTIHIDVSDLAAGSYLIRATMDDKSATQRIILK